MGIGDQKKTLTLEPDQKLFTLQNKMCKTE